MKKIFTLLFILVSLFAQSQTVVISQFYGAGGNTGATLNADYVELHNVSSVPQSLSGLSIQYASATNTGTWTGVSALPVATIPAGGYYLIQMSSTGANGVALPTPDYISSPTIAMSGTSGKLALVNGITALGSTGAGCPATAVIDFVGYGTANCGETAPTPVLTTTDAAFRNNNGCTDTNNNLSDFTIAPVAPRNSASPVFVCGGGPNPPSLTAGTLVDFGNVVVGTNSTSQNFNLSGANLTGFPGTITINAPSTDFQVSNDNASWGASTTIPFTSATLAATPVYVRFTPQSLGLKTGNVTISGGGVSTAVTVAVRGTGIAASGPTITIGGTFNPFGNVCVNTTVGPNAFTISGTNLTAADITVGPLESFTFSTTAGGTYTTTLTITHAPGAVNQVVFVKFTPTAAISYSGNIPVNGGGISTQVNVAASGVGVNGAPSVTTGTSSAITTVSATLAGSIPSIGCSAITAYGIEYSLTAGFANGTGTQSPSSNLSAGSFSSAIAGLSAATTYYYHAFATNAGGTTYGSELSFTTAAPPPPVLSATALADFGAVCINSNGGPNSFDLTGVNLSTADITVGPLEGYAFSSNATGPFTSSLVITQAGGAVTETVYVQFTPAAEITYNGNIPVSGAGAATINVPVTGSGFISTPVVITLDSTSVLPTVELTSGRIVDPGCTAVTEYGIEYSGINGFADGTGIKVPSTELNGADFTSRLSGLVQNTAYYYKAYAVNTGGVAYGEQKTFFSAGIPAGLVLYSIPVVRGTNMHYTLSGIKPGHYAVRIYNSVGQLVFQKDMIVQVNFIDDNFIFPAKLPIGMYTFEVYNPVFNIHKTFLVQ
jgi:uncharacterized protein YjbI with pentapeptide repeats